MMPRYKHPPVVGMNESQTFLGHYGDWDLYAESGCFHGHVVARFKDYEIRGDVKIDGMTPMERTGYEPALLEAYRRALKVHFRGAT